MNDGFQSRFPGQPQHLADGRYELIEPLGEGGMAVVWRAMDHRLGVERALKLLHPEVASRRSYRSRFLAEARTMARIEHPNILRVLDVGEHDGRPYFTMEIVTGGALIDILENQGRIPPLQALDITFQTLQALAAAHVEGVVHRDVKPDNVLLSADGTARLSDFGIARIRNERVDHRTRTGVAMGTVGYMAPEQRENARGVGPPADFYAVGATLYALVTGCEPPDLFAAHLDPKLLEGVPPAIRDVIRNACTYRPEKRYPHARAMAVDVARAYDAIARGLGETERGGQWIVRFDDLLAEQASRTGSAGRRHATATGTPEATTRQLQDDDLPPEKGARRPTLTPAGAPRHEAPPFEVSPSRRTSSLVLASASGLLLIVLGVVALGTGLWVGRAMLSGPGGTCAGVWEGTRDNPIGPPSTLRLDLRANAAGGVDGVAVTTFMDEQLEMRVRGRCDGPTLDLAEVGDRPDSGRYRGERHGEGYGGTFEARSGGVVSFRIDPVEPVAEAGP